MKWGEIVDGEKQFPLHPGQVRAIKSTSRFVALISGTGGGKSSFLPLLLAQEIKKHPGQTWLLIAPTYRMLRDVTSRALVECFRGTDFEGRATQDRYFLPDGGSIFYVSSDNEESIQGYHAMGAGIDEAGQISQAAWNAIQARVGYMKGRIFISTTPYAINWLKTDFYDKYMSGDNNYDCIVFESIMNPTYDIAEFERRRKELPQWKFDMLYRGLFTSPTGLVFPGLEKCVIPHMSPPEGEYIGGLDWGWADAFAGLGAVNYIDENGKDIIYVFWERYKTKTLVDDHAKALPEGFTWYADPSQPEFIAQMGLRGHCVRKAVNDIIPGIEAVNRRINTRTLLISDKCKALIAEAGQYFYAEEDEVKAKEKKVKGLDHACDALRYLIYNIDRRREA